MAIYIGIIAFTVLLGIIINANETNYKKKFFLITIFSLIAVFSALRSKNVGMDTEQFFSMYNVIRALSWDRLHELRYEWGYMILCKLLSYISTSPQLLIIVSSIFISFSVGRFIYKNSTDVVMSTYIYITFNIWSMYMNVLRQAIAIAIIMIGFEFLKKRKWIIFGLFVLLAMTFHTSAIFVLVLIPCLLKKTFTQKTVQLVTIICIFGFFFFNKIFDLATKLLGVYGSYSSGKYAQENYFGAALGLLLFLILFIIGGMCKPSESRLRYKDIIHLNIEENFALIALAMSIALFCYVLGMRMNILSRMMLYFQYFIMIWLPWGIASIGEQREKTILTYSIYVVLLLNFVIINIYRPGWYGIVPYEFYWQLETI